MTATTLPTFALAVLLVAVLMYTAFQYNRLVVWRNRVRNGLAQIDVQLVRRSDLIQNLVETVKGYATHERVTLASVTLARYRGSSSTRSAEAAAQAQSAAIPGLFAIAEAYPVLKADEGFLNLQEELTHSEDRIAYARQFYNDAVNRYNTMQETFPTVLVAKLGSFKHETYFQAADDDRQAVSVSL